MMLLLALFACSKAVSSQGGPGALPVFNEPRQVSLSLVGYNYTNRYINEFSVGGEGGGNLYVSSPAGGGGGTVCCAKYWPGVKGYKVKVRWQTGACYYKVRASDSHEVHQRLFPFFKEAEVEVDERATDRARYMEVHFYPDGSVQVAATEHPSPPRLVLDREREDKTRYPRCPNDDKPGQ
ncbi:DUF3304 domain-containing protein [Massilia sp. G4R7]|uniref:DUF3304 domain-containing protein n=1 Tax=Massilia phyllostachyos TaxID=2898585 RepID=A0ABS8QBL6_9BURK|nr:DUF3304 domain-containing protein [Massilia phyllostachyos]MCD2518437.1 DUF3304 domain-containing protein [Massilia phyllostachyos]